MRLKRFLSTGGVEEDYSTLFDGRAMMNLRTCGLLNLNLNMLLNCCLSISSNINFEFFWLPNV